MGEAKQRKLLRAFGKEVSDGNGRGLYTVSRYDLPDPISLLMATLEDGPSGLMAQAVMLAVTRASAAPKPPMCMSCDNDVPMIPPPPSVAIIQPGLLEDTGLLENTPRGGIIVMFICEACHAKQQTPAEFQQAALKAMRDGLMPDAKVINVSAPGHA